MAEKVMHGPMWQFECKTCNYMGDCWDTEREAAEEMQNHKCVDALPSWAREEMERLRTAGDALAEAALNDLPSDWLVWNVAAWREARRG